MRLTAYELPVSMNKTTAYEWDYSLVLSQFYAFNLCVPAVLNNEY